MVLASALDIFSRSGLSYLSRWSHVFVGITWIGLLYFFNFVQVPAYAEMEASARNNAVDKLTSRALWWFRWAAAATLVSGILLLLFQVDAAGKTQLFSSDYAKSLHGISIYAGVLLAVTMFLNVWLVIWPNQKKVIANARNVQAGGQADPSAAAAARKGALASRQNTIYSLPMLIFMVAFSVPERCDVGREASNVLDHLGRDLGRARAECARLLGRTRSWRPEDHLRHPPRRDHHRVRLFGGRADPLRVHPDELSVGHVRDR
jgi:uncharacterized membrane protein